MKLVKFNSLEDMKGLIFINHWTRVFHVLKMRMCFVFLIGLFLMGCNNESLKTGYIDINRVNQEYKVAIDFEERLKELKITAKEQCIPFQEAYMLLSDSITKIKGENGEPSQGLIGRFIDSKKNYEAIQDKSFQDLQDSIAFYKDLLNEKINKHVFDFAQKEGYHYVFSPAGSGVFMFGDSSLNITNQVITYLNAQ
ncbi:MAG: hypothetical protein CMP61_08610 [Flavobacteriales bacterium]|nr:hypothetical protein [Flavobacteriales bacterium]